ncbi:MAG: MarR family transcriptional regulator [Nitrococcus sp.]|nr:MarR family transcriptional regulator [Nitrococcus sp.]
MNATADPLAGMSHTRARILRYIKAQGSVTRRELAAHLDITREAARQHLQGLSREGWLADSGRRASTGQGRPARLFALTRAGDHLFPKHYDQISLEMFDTLAERFGEEGVRTLLASLTDKQVAYWAPRLRGLSLSQRLEALRGIYFEQDPYTHIERDGDDYLLVERNCPFLNLAVQRPRLCSVTVSTLRRLLGVHVHREQRFQDGDRRCVFRVCTRIAVDADYRFDFEEDDTPVHE